MSQNHPILFVLGAACKADLPSSYFLSSLAGNLFLVSQSFLFSWYDPLHIAASEFHMIEATCCSKGVLPAGLQRQTLQRVLRRLYVYLVCHGRQDSVSQPAKAVFQGERLKFIRSNYTYYGFVDSE